MQNAFDAPFLVIISPVYKNHYLLNNASLVNTVFSIFNFFILNKMKYSVNNISRQQKNKELHNMSDKFKNSKFYKTMKDPKISRAIYISLVLLLVAVVAIVGITVAANRKQKQPVADGTQNTPSTNPPSTNTPPVTETPDEPQTPDQSTGTDNGTPSKPVVDQLPDFSLPVSGKVTEHHDPKLQVFSDTMNDYRVHLGIDISTDEGAPVYAAADGTVSKIWKDPMMGYSVAISHSGDSVTVYKNLSNTLPEGIEEGVKVKAGQQIASVGESALTEIAEESHLHFEMTVGGILVDPLEYYSAKELEALAVDTAYEN